jgi:hypothetical protein
MVKSYTMLPNLNRPTVRTRNPTAPVLISLVFIHKTLLLVHHRIDRVTLNGKTWVVCCGINAHVMTLHVAVRGGELHARMTYDL